MTGSCINSVIFYK